SPGSSSIPGIGSAATCRTFIFPASTSARTPRISLCPPSRPSSTSRRTTPVVYSWRNRPSASSLPSRARNTSGDALTTAAGTAQFLHLLAQQVLVRPERDPPRLQLVQEIEEVHARAPRTEPCTRPPALVAAHGLLHEDLAHPRIKCPPDQRRAVHLQALCQRLQPLQVLRRQPHRGYRSRWHRVLPENTTH